MACRGAALDPIEPTIGSPAEIVRDSVSIFETKTGKADLGIAVRDVVVIAIGIKQQIGRVQHKDAAAPDCNAGGNIQSCDKVFLRLEESVPVLVLENRDLVRAVHMTGRWHWNFVKDRAQVFVVLNNL